MTNRLFCVLFAIAASSSPRLLHAQFTDARTYTVGPVGANQFELNYSYAHASASIDTSLEVVGAHLVLNEATLSYTHTFSALGHLAWVKVNVPFASVSGSVGGTNTSGATTLGVGLTVTAPTGEYDAEKLVNLGEHRWSFKPEFAVSYPFGPERRWEVDAYINAYFFTDNTEYHGVEILRQ